MFIINYTAQSLRCPSPFIIIAKAWPCMLQLIYMQKIASQIFISGRVQGVGFRRFAQQKAQGLGIQGWARNLLDGRVEIHAIATESILNEYLDLLRQGPVFSQVREVMAKNVDLNTEAEFTEFSIHPDQEVKS